MQEGSKWRIWSLMFYACLRIKDFIAARVGLTDLWFVDWRNNNPYISYFLFQFHKFLIKKTNTKVSLLTLILPFPHSSMTLVFLKQSGKSNSTTTTNGITANGETALAVLSMNANQTKRGVLCGSIKRPSTEQKWNQYCWTISFQKNVPFQTSKKPYQRHTATSLCSVRFQ